MPPCAEVRPQMVVDEPVQVFLLQAILIWFIRPAGAAVCTAGYRWAAD